MNQKEHIKEYSGPAAGWGALKAVTKSWLGSENAFRNLRAMLKTNQNGGFDCPGCAWGESPESGMVNFCENGAKAVNWESTSRLVDPDFFAKYSVSELAKQTDYWLEYQGRLSHPMRYDSETDHYVEISWDDAFAMVGRHLNALASPDEAEFYTSGRASNEAAYIYQLFVRAFGTNNFPDCSNMCHEASGIGMSDTIGVGKGTVVFKDLELADAIFVIGQNPGTNHPRMLEPLREAVKRGAQVICLNPLKERGLERFQHPQHPIEMLSNGSEPTSSAYFRPALGGDMAVFRGMAKFLLQWEREAQALGEAPVFDHDFIREHTTGVDAYLNVVDRTSWKHITQQSGLGLDEIEVLARMYRRAERVVMCWAMGLTVHIATKLNRSHLVTGRDALILPCLGRTEIDIQANGPQGVTVEDTFSMVHLSYGQLKARSPSLRSEPAILAGIAKATLGNFPIDWDWAIADYSHIRDLIADTIPGFENFNQRLQHPGGFYLGNTAARREWNTASGKAQFAAPALPEQLVNENVIQRGDAPDLILQTLRSHDQYNTTLYGLDDRYRGVFGMRDVVFVNAEDIRRLGYEPGDKVDLVTLWDDGLERRVSGFELVAYDIPTGQAAAYYPETNPLVPLDSYGDRTFTPTSKFVAIKLEKAKPSSVIPTTAL